MADVWYKHLTNVKQQLMIGTVNAAYVPLVHNNYTDAGGHCQFQGTSVVAVTNVATGTLYPKFILPLPTNRGGLKLKVKASMFSIHDVDANNYISVRILTGGGATSTTNIDTNNDDLDAVSGTGNHEDEFPAPYDIGSSYGIVGMQLTCETDTAGALDFIPYLLVYYDE
jgi:hypothetical protein